MNQVRSALVMALAGMLAGSIAASAQVASDTVRLPELVVTATKVAPLESAVPAATTVLHGDDLRARGIVFLMDALREVPGMMIVQTGSYGAPVSLFLRGGNSNYVRVLLDGVPLNPPGGSINLANLTVTDLDRIEVVRGAASVLYGADAMSGVVQLFTRGASGGTHGEVTADGGTFGTNNVTGHLGVAGPGSAWSLSATGSRFESDGTYEFNSGYRNSVGSARLAWDGGARGRAALVARYGDAIDHFPTDGGGAVIDHNQFTTERSLAIDLDAARSLGGGVMGNLQGFAGRLNAGSQNRPDSPADTNGFGYDGESSIITWRRGVDGRLDWRTNPRTLLSLGLGAERETDDESSRTVSNFGFGASTDTGTFSAGRTTKDAYVQLLADPSAKASFQLGARVDDNSSFGTFGTWRVGGSFRLSPTFRAWGALGTAFKAPTFSQLMAHSAFEVGNPDLLPERSTNREIGIETQSPSKDATLDVTAFSQTFRDLIQYVSAAPGDPTYVNLGAATSRGIELALTLIPMRNESVRVHWTWLKTEVTDTGSASSVTFEPGATLIRRPASSGGVTLTRSARGVTFSTTVTRIGERDDADFRNFPASRVTLPAYTTVDLALDAPIRRPSGRSPGLDLMLRGENIFKASYEQTVGFPGRGRTLLAGGRLRF